MNAKKAKTLRRLATREARQTRALFRAWWRSASRWTRFWRWVFRRKPPALQGLDRKVYRRIKKEVREAEEWV